MNKQNCSRLHSIAIFVYIGGYLCIINSSLIIYTLISFRLHAEIRIIFFVLLAFMVGGVSLVCIFDNFFIKNCIDSKS